MKPRTRRLGWIVGGLAALGIAAALVLNAFQSNLVFFFTPTQVAAREAPQGRPFRVGGLVEAGSLAREPNSCSSSAPSRRWPQGHSSALIPCSFPACRP